MQVTSSVLAGQLTVSRSLLLLLLLLRYDKQLRAGQAKPSAAAKCHSSALNSNLAGHLLCYFYMSSCSSSWGTGPAQVTPLWKQ